MASPQERVAAWCLNQVGYVAASSKQNTYAVYMDSLGFYNGPKNGYDWCDVFADCAYVKCFGKANALAMTYQVEGGGGAGCWISAAWYRNNGAWSSKPGLGRQIFFGTVGDEYHTGIVVGYTSTTVTTVEGNTGYNYGYSGGAVMQQTYSLNDSRIAGYGVPNWALVDTEDEMTEADLKKIRTIVQEEVAKTPVKVWSYKNAKYENVDAYRILRDVRDAVVGKPAGKPADTSAAKTNRIQTIIDGVNNAVSLIKQYIKQL